MKIVTIVVVVSLVFYFLSRPASSSVTNSQKSPITPTITNTPNHPLSIDSLSTRKFEPQKLKLVRTISPTTQVVSYLSDGLTLNALMIKPSGDAPSEGWPVVIVNHGFIPPKDYSVTSSYINTSNFFASQGFVVLKPDYRGHDQSEGESSGRLFSRSEYTVDVLNLMAAIDSIPSVNPNKIFMYGHSMGGDVTLQILEISPKITAATLWAPAVALLPEQVTHFMNRNRPTPGQSEIFKSQYDEFIRQYPISQISSLENIGLIKVPLNLHHGTKDESVPYSWGTDLNDKLKTANKTVNFYSYPGDNHDISGSFGKALSRDVQFFKSFL